MELFNNYIDEYVDWVTGEDTSQLEEEEKIRVSSTNGLPVSGGSIRELLLTKLKKPFVYYEDTKAGLYRLFSSETTKQKWIRMNTEGSADYDPAGSEKLELFNFVRPSDVVLTYQGLNSNPKYIVNGDNTANAAQLEFNVYLSKEQGGSIIYESDAFIVTYKIINSYGVERTIVEEKDTSFVNSTKKVTKNIYSYLTVGQNTVTVIMKARNSSAQNSCNFSIYLMDFTLESTFNYAAHWSPNQSLEVPVSVHRSDTSLTLLVDIYIDRTASSPGIHAGTWSLNTPEPNPTKTFYLDNNYTSNVTSQDHVKHTMTIIGSLHKESGEYYYSNVLYYDFIVASDTIGIVNKFVTTGYSLPYNKVNIDEGTNRIIIVGDQYEPISLNWSYYTDRETTGLTENIEWAIKTIGEESGQPVITYSPIAIVEGLNRFKGEPFRFIPDFETDTNPNILLVALDSNGNEIDVFPISITKSNLNISETGGYSLKLSAYGKTNSSPNKNVWEDSTNSVTSTFNNILFDENSGWSDNSFITSGNDQSLIVNYCPFPSDYNLAGAGKTIEIDFMPEKVSNDGDVVITIGDPERGCIKITTNEAAVYSGNTSIVHTNYKAYERIKLAFVFNPVTVGNVNSNLVYIINNGVLERAAAYGAAAQYRSSSGNIKIGGSESGVRVYSIRAYNKALSYVEALNNFIYDSENKAEIINRNDIFTSSVIDYTKVKNKIDTIVIEGNLSNLLTQSSEKKGSETTVNFKRECITDASKSFEVVNGMIRKHGLSTLNYPITSMKIWTNKNKEGLIAPIITLSEALRAEGLNKNRYIMKTGAIPANKFVLQANYADSSGVHNGGLLRLINDTWYNALDSEGRHILRTAPQLFTSGETLVHDDEDLNEDGTWIEGTGVGAAENKTWAEISNKPFPYKIRTAPDSFPCAVFYRNGNNDSLHFLGQYVFMDDKKSDYLYGERSIYHYGSDNDPFVLKIENTKNGPNGKLDTSANCVWDNKDVLRIEVVLPNTRLTSYMDFNVTDTGGNTHACTDIKYNNKGEAEQYYWEDYFELIYPDDEDVAKDDAESGLTKFSSSSKFVRKVTPFINFLKWITDCKNNYNVATDWWAAGTYNNTLDAFKATAHNHLDMYKLAAYYIFFLRFGLVDSVERNAQLKTYDGQHWHYEPWDMDIALGNTNQGALVLNPPMSRTTFEPGTTTYAFSGKSATTSNVLWDCLESWDYWIETVVPNVAQSLFNAGLTYDNIIKVFDEEYAEAWSETMYNLSGFFKYIENGGSDWLAWLQGSRTSHRHWWISTSMNYYDAKWSCGSFNEHRVRLFADKAINPVTTDIIIIKPVSDTYFKVAQLEGRTNLGFKPATRSNPAQFDVSTAAFSAKDPAYIYGGTFIEEIDLSCFAEKLKAVDFSLCYDNVLGAPIKKINVGIPYTVVSATQYSGKVSGTQLRLTGYDVTTGNDAFANLQTLDITGQSTITNTLELLATRNRKNISNLFAIGSGITEFTSSTSGNQFDVIKLPGVTTTTYTGESDTVVSFNTLTMQNSSWNTIEFWDTVKSGDITYVRDGNDEIVVDDEGNPVLVPNIATFTKSTIPTQLSTVQFIGSTARNECAGQFLLDWIDAIDASLPVGHTEEDLYAALSTKVFEAENINWGVEGQSISITFNDLARIAHFNEGNNSGGKIKGYIMISDVEPLTAVQLNLLSLWFGPTVFSKSNRNSGLVVDQGTDYVRITTTGTTLINNEITLEEGQSATMIATKFMLSETSLSEYTWSMVEGLNGRESEQDTVKSAHLMIGDDGVVHLVTYKSGIHGDYYLTICAAKAGTIPEYLTIKIISAILPDHFTVETASASTNARKFYINDTMGTQMSLLSGKIRNVLDNSIRDSFVLFYAGQKVEFYPVAVNGNTPSNIDIGNIRYSISPNLLSTPTSYIELANQGNDPSLNVSDGILYYTKNALHNGIEIGVSNLPQDMTLYELNIVISVGDATFTKTVNILVYDDSVIMHKNSTSASVQHTLNDLHSSLYGDTLDNYYKSDLLSLTGTFAITSLNYTEATSSLLTTALTEPLIKYLKNITTINLTGCYRLHVTDICDYTNGEYVFPALPSLLTLNLNGCTGMNGITIDFSECNSLTTVKLGNTNTLSINPKFTSNLSHIQTIQLGRPTSINILNPLELTVAGVSVVEKNNLDSIDLVNIPNGATFNMFGKIF